VSRAQGAWVQRQFRLTRSQDFERVRRAGKSYAHPLLLLVAMAGPEGRIRVGVSAGRRVGVAVKRNRAKRLLRAAMQDLLTRLVPGWDIVLVARRPLVSAQMSEAREALLTLLQRAKLILPA
jgi:ribonuclease P protein component